MKSSFPRPAGSRLRRVTRYGLGAIGMLAAGSVAVGLLTGFHLGVHPMDAPAPKQGSADIPQAKTVGIRTVVIPDGIDVESDLTYGTAPDGTLLTLDACMPPSAKDEATPARPAVIGIHGGSWAHGDKADTDWRLICRWLASEGFVAYSIDYRLVPNVIYPAAINDVTKAVKWIRDPKNVQRFNIDPKRIGVLGGSAGANLAAQLGLQGHGPTDTGTRVAAVAELSGPVDLTAVGQKLGHPVPYVPKIELAYLGCTTFTECPHAKNASPLYDVDSSDPPVFIGQSTNELIPREQGDALAAALAAAGVPHQVITRPGTLHSIGALDATMRAALLEFLHHYLD